MIKDDSGENSPAKSVQINAGESSLPPWINTLEPISKFIGTYGLAVFLVVYYAIWLYPDAFKERGAWITQIEELRRSINPEEKPMSPSQAESILDYVTDLYFLNIQSELPLNTFSYSLPGGGMIGGGFSLGVGFGGSAQSEETKPANSIEIFSLGSPVYLDKKKSISDQVSKLITESKKSIRISAQDNVTTTYEPILNRAIDNALKSSSRLRLFNYGDASLYELWTTIITNNEEQFRKDLLNSFVESNIQRQYRSLYNELKQKTGYLGEDFEFKEYERPNQVINRYQRIIKSEWLNALKSSNKKIQPTAESGG